jgi:helix-turn-helix protein
MPTSTLIPHTRIDNSIIDDCAAQIGIYGLGIYVAIKRHLNQRTGDCYPSYQTIARKLGIDRSTVIRYVKKLKALNLLSPLLRFKEDGSPTSNQYNFNPRESETFKGSGTKQPEIVVEDNQLSSTEPPEQPSSSNKKQRTITDVDFFPTNPPQTPDKSPINSHIFPSMEQNNPFAPTEKQRNCPHPPTEIVFLADNVTICHHCYGLLDENLKLVSEDKTVENACAA